jgi:hypothetical protein
MKDTKSYWTNLGDKTKSFIAIVNSFKGRDAVFFQLDERMFDLLTFLICIVMKLFCVFISFLWNHVLWTREKYSGVINIDIENLPRLPWLDIYLFRNVRDLTFTMHKVRIPIDGHVGF